MSTSGSPAQGLSTDKFLFFFLGVRKGEVRQRVKRLEERYPGESSHQLSTRVVAAQRPLSLLGGVLLELPALLPAIGTHLRLLGVAGATSAMVHMHTSMILEIALIHGFDIDEKARLKEIAVVFATTGLMSAAPALSRRHGLGLPLSLITGTLAVTALGELIGKCAIAYYQRQPAAIRQRGKPTLRGVPSPAGAGSAS